MTSALLPPLPLPSGITEIQVDCPVVGLSFHLLAAGYDGATQRPLVLCLHGFPVLAFSWRKIMPRLAEAGYTVVAVDQRGYGRTTGWDTSPFDKADLDQFTMSSLVRDMVVLVNALGYSEVACVVGHDFGAVSASMCALMRPDLFRSVVMMSHPFKGSPSVPFNTARKPAQPVEKFTDVHQELATLSPPRKHYKWYNSTAAAASDWETPPQGLHAFLRGYIHVKSADWKQNNPHPLQNWSAPELAKMPYYYIMPLNATMPETVAELMKGEDASKSKKWMPDDALAVYVQEWTRTGFQGGLNWYRSQTDETKMKDLLVFAGKRIEVPSIFITGEKDWGNYQQPGAIDSYPSTCSDFRGVVFIQGAGHWPQQEQPEQTASEILAFLKSL